MLNKLKQIFKNSDSEESTFQWRDLVSLAQLDEINAKSFKTPQILFKHSTRCSISSMAKRRVETLKEPAGTGSVYLLDLIQFREVSNKIADQYQVQHQSPQWLLIVNGKCVYHASHGNINWVEMNSALSETPS